MWEILFTNAKLWGVEAWGIVIEQLVKKMKSNVNWIKFNPQLSNNINAVDDATMVAYFLWKIIIHLETMNLEEVEGREKNLFKLGANTHALNEYFSIAMYPLNT